MAVVQSAGQIQRLQTSKEANWFPMSSYGSLNLYGDVVQDYASIYRTQPNVRTVVSFLARNIAQIGLKVYRRVATDERQQLSDHPLAKLIRRPNYFTTRYRLLESLVTDIGTYDNAFWLKIRNDQGGISVLRMPPQFVEDVGGNRFAPTKYRLFGVEALTYDASEVVHFRGHNPDNPKWGLSPLESLRRVLAEEAAAGDYREYHWRNHSRAEVALKHPNTLSLPAQERLRAQWDALYTGASNSGKTAILEEGMDLVDVSVSAKDAQYIEARKLTREEVASAYHVSPAMVGILEHANFANIKEQHKMLYQDSLGPWLVMIEEDIELQLMPEFDNTDDVYVEFNISEKLKGTFEEQAQILQSAVGRPYMTADEARAYQNMKPMGGDAAQLVTPLNVLIGGQASPRDSTPDTRSRGVKARGDIQRRQGHVAKHEQALKAFYERRRDTVLSRMGAKAVKDADDLVNLDKWNAELHGILFALSNNTASDFGKEVARSLGSDYDADRALDYVDESSRIAAEALNQSVKDEISAALDEDDAVEALKGKFDILLTSTVAQVASTRVTTMSSFGRHEGAAQGGAKTKTWVTVSAKPRPSHGAVAGETVPIDENFSLGGRWPGDPAMGPSEVANCSCTVDFGGNE